jgi:hypothetical protein
MIDVNKITSVLAKLQDPQLQQYAQMHKNDPYIMALAMSESNRRKEVRAASQAPQGGQQPKVVDSEIAQMAPRPAQAMPEDQGIAQIPAGNMNFAGGGIIAFADGGDVERFNGQSKSWVEDFLYSNTTPVERARRERLQAEADAARLPTPFEQERAANMKALAAGSTYTPEAYGVVTPAPAYTDPRQVGMPPAAPAAPKAADAAPTADTTRRTAPAAAPAAAATPGIGMPSYAGLDVGAMTKKAMEEAGKQEHPQAKELGEIGAARVKAKEAEVTGLEAIQQKFDNIFKGRKERMDTKEGEIAKMGDQNLGLALLNAGAAMMGKRGTVGEAIGAGIDTGSKQYVAGLDKINSAKDKLTDARDRLEEIDAQRGELSARELFKARNDVKNTQIGAKEDMVKANMQMYNLNREQALKQVDNQIKINLSQIEQQGAAGRTAAQIASNERIAAMPTGADRTAMMLGEGTTDRAKLESGLKKMQDITSDKTGMAAFKILGEINAKHANDPSFKPLTMSDLTAFLGDYQRSMRAGPANVSGKPTGKAFE